MIDRTFRSFAALSNPIRCKLLSLLRRKESTAEALSSGFKVSRPPAISQHLKILVDAGLVSTDKRGRHTYYSAVPGALDTLHRCLDFIEFGLPDEEIAESKASPVKPKRKRYDPNTPEFLEGSCKVTPEGALVISAVYSL